MAQFSFDPSQYELQKSFEPLPPGWYPAVIKSSEIVPTSKGDGFRLKMEFEIIDGPGKGRVVTSGYNIQNPNPEAVRIAYSELKTIAACIGVFSPIQDTQQFHGRPLQIRLVAQKDSDYNEVKGYKDINGNDASKVGAPAAPAPQGPVPVPPQGFAQPQQAAWAPPQQPAYQVAPPAPAAPPAWAPQTAAAPAPAAPPAWAPPPQQAAPVAAPAGPPAWAPPAAAAAPAGYAPPAPPAWAPQNAPPAPPAWAQPQG